MGTDYRLHIHRKVDGKELGVINANQLKTIFDSEFADKIGCEGRCSADGKKFEYDALSEIEELASNKLETYYDQIHEKKLMIMGAANVDVKHDLEEDIRYLKSDYIDGIKWVILNTSFLKGMINCVVEDLYYKNGLILDDGTEDTDPGYKYHGADLPTTKRTYANGDEYDDPQWIWNRDVYCVIEAC